MCNVADIGRVTQRFRLLRYTAGLNNNQHVKALSAEEQRTTGECNLEHFCKCFL